MNEEIKEILDDLKDKCKYIEDYGYQYKRLSLEDTNLLLDYITNLQEELKSANDSITWWSNRFNAVQRDYEDYKSRIDKAIEYIKEFEYYIPEDDVPKLLNIMQGYE